MSSFFDEIVSAVAPPPESAETIGESREGRPLLGWRFGSGALGVSLIGGCHADEPVGPAFLRYLAGWLGRLPAGHHALADTSWWIVPDANPDGAARNDAWIRTIGAAVDPVAYLRHVYREPPGDDVEFGFPRGVDDPGARPENRALFEWWRAAAGPFALHASLHGMAVAEGPWFLIERSWADRSAELQDTCRRETTALGYRLHDVDRKGEKGFWRIGPGFTSRPDSRAMARHFIERGDPDTAALFRPSSMETIVALGGDPLTLVSEMPLFLIPPRPGGEPSGSEEVAAWNRRLADWRMRLAGGAVAPEKESAVRRDVDAHGLVPMPVRDQMRLQCVFVEAGLAAVRAASR